MHGICSLFILYPRNVVHRHGLFEEIGLEETASSYTAGERTGQQLDHQMGEVHGGEIIAKYDGCSTAQYLLPIITNPCADGRTQYRNAISRINVALKEVASLAGLNIPLTMHCARHCWASIAKSKKHTAFGHQRGNGARFGRNHGTYLASLDTNVVDKANSLILKDL